VSYRLVVLVFSAKIRYLSEKIKMKSGKFATFAPSSNSN
jgi:hypothetical protein